MSILKTKRLKLTIAKDEDIYPLYRDCFSDWEVMKFLLGKTFTLRETEIYIQKHFSKGQLLDFMVMKHIDNNEILGYAGMFTYNFNGRDNEYEFGYILKKEAWGKGYATEISIGQIEMLKNSFDNASIIATSHPKNLASKRVLEKVGMKLVEVSVELANRGIRDIYKVGT